MKKIKRASKKDAVIFNKITLKSDSLTGMRQRRREETFQVVTDREELEQVDLRMLQSVHFRQDVVKLVFRYHLARPLHPKPKQ